jgi:hypothetical protein
MPNDFCVYTSICFKCDFLQATQAFNRSICNWRDLNYPAIPFPSALTQLKCVFALCSCAGIAALWGFLSVYWHWRNWEWFMWWLVLGPFIVGFAGIYRILRSR